MAVKIRELAYYHPKKSYANSYYLDYYDNKGIDIRGMLKSTGREQRYISRDKNENSLTMAIRASKKVLDKAQVLAEEIGLIVFISGTPEFLSPVNALKIHYELKCGTDAVVYDMNCNCVGMVVAVDQISRMMKSNKNIKYALVVASEQLDKYSQPGQAITYANFGECSCAIVLEKSENEESDFIDSIYYTDSSLNESIQFPPNGLSKILAQDSIIPKEQMVIQWNEFDTEGAFRTVKSTISKLLERNGIDQKEIKKYCVSQFAKSSIDFIREQLGEAEEKFPFVGNTFGYTGATSPFLTLAKCIERNEVKRGDYIIFWSVGAGYTCSSLLMRY